MALSAGIFQHAEGLSVGCCAGVRWRQLRIPGCQVLGIEVVSPPGDSLGRTGLAGHSGQRGKPGCSFLPTCSPCESIGVLEAFSSFRCVWTLPEGQALLQERDCSQEETAGAPIRHVSSGPRLQICNFQHLHLFCQIRGKSYKAVMCRAQLSGSLQNETTEMTLQQAQRLACAYCAHFCTTHRPQVMLLVVQGQAKPLP